MLTRFEITRIISARAHQIALGSPTFIKVKDEKDPFLLAKAEFDAKVLPILVLRTLPNGEIVYLDLDGKVVDYGKAKK
ncbi:MAG: DNA-directed RNA polymerase subunit K [archaeon]